MTKRERVLNSMNLQPVDRPPVGFWFHFPKEQAFGEACVQAHLDYYNNIDVDLVKIMCDGYFDYPNPVAKSVKDPSDWYKMQPLGKDSPFIKEQVERARLIKAGLKDELAVFYNVFAPFSLLRFGAGNDLVMEHLKRDPKAIEYALSVVTKDAALLSELLITEGGIDGLYYCVQGNENTRFTPEEYTKYVAPSDLAVLEHANKFSDNNILHCCGWEGIPNNLSCWQNYPAKTINWACYVENMGLREGKEFFGGKCVLGGFDNRKDSLIVNGSKAEIQAETLRLIEEAGTLGVILGADCTIPNSIDREHFTWVVEAVETLKK